MGETIMIYIFGIFVVIIVTSLFNWINKDISLFFIKARKKVRKKIEDRPCAETSLLDDWEVDSDLKARAQYILESLAETIGVSPCCFQADDRMVDILSLSSDEIKLLATPKVLKKLKLTSVDTFEPFADDFNWTVTKLLDLNKEGKMLKSRGIIIKNEDQWFDFYLKMTVQELVNFCIPLLREKGFQKWLHKKKKNS